MTLSLHKNTIKALLIILYIGISSIVVFGLSAVFTYLNTGADRNLMLYNKVNETVHYQPIINWNIDHTLGRQMDQVTLKKIEKDYLNAWYVKSIAFKKNTLKGLKDYFTKSSLQTISDGIAHNLSKNITINTTSLNHNTSIDFFSEDGQQVVITDSNVREHKRIYKNKKLQFATTEVNTYRYILLLEDGFWRIRHILKTEPTTKHQLNFPSKNLDVTVKGINYYPRDTPWDLFGEEFSTEVLSKDFNIIKEANLNTIRVFIQYEDFGKSEIKPEKLAKLKQLLDCAQDKNLKVILTLFDFYGNYDVLDWTLNIKHALTIVENCKDHPALLAWDVKNEPNLDFESRGKEKVIAWLKQILTTVKSTDQTHPVTIGWSNIESAKILHREVDFLSFHYYEDLNKLADEYGALKKAIPNKDIVLGEYGISSYRGFWNPFGNSEEDQANYHKKFQEIAQTNQIEFLSWTLYDFTKIPKEVVGKLPWRKNIQKHFGFINKNQQPKKSFQYISKP
ncbi:cellulase family glycosylhydrolase [Wenyingzhuangia sp. IMCC45574]